jgi:hypothetical protein
MAVSDAPRLPRSRALYDSTRALTIQSGRVASMTTDPSPSFPIQNWLRSWPADRPGRTALRERRIVFVPTTDPGARTGKVRIPRFQIARLTQMIQLAQTPLVSHSPAKPVSSASLSPPHPVKMAVVLFPI